MLFLESQFMRLDMDLKKDFSRDSQVPRVGMLCSEYNKDLVLKLYEGAKTEFQKQSLQIVKTIWVPGAGEIPQASTWFIEKYNLSALLACGVLIRGETAHFESLCRILEKALIPLQNKFSIPVIFSVLMLENRRQAEDRLGGSKGHRGEEAAQALIKMLRLKQTLQEGK